MMAMAAAASTFAAAGVLLCIAAAAAFVTTAHAKTADGDLVAKSCANATGPDRSMWLQEKFCTSRLRLDKRSAAAEHPRDLALIATDLTQRAVADAYAKVDDVLRSSAGRQDNSTATLILLHCQLDYAAVTSTIPVCRDMVEHYKKPAHAANQLAPNDYFECSHRLRKNTYDCLNHISGSELWEPLFRVVGEAWLRTILVEGMLEEMLGVVSDDHEIDTVINRNVS